jgi:hypothetical protein
MRFEALRVVWFACESIEDKRQDSVFSVEKERVYTSQASG